MSGQVEHFGFQALSANKKVNSVTHIFLKNTELVPGTLEQMLFEVPFASLPADRSTPLPWIWTGCPPERL